MRALSGTASAARHIGGVGLQAILVVGIVVALVLAVSLISKPAANLVGPQSVLAGRSGSITVPDGVFGGTTTATLNPGGSGVWAHAECFQAGKRVYAEYVKADSLNEATFRLGPTPNWSSGPADCTAEEGTWARNGRWRVVADTTFHVSG